MRLGAPPSIYSQISPVFTTAERGRALWDTVEQLAHIGTWDWDRRTDAVLWSDNMYRLVGFEPGEIEPTPQLLFDHMHPGDVERLQTRFLSHREGKAELASSEFRVIRRDGAVRHLVITPLGWEATESGSLDLLVGFVRDVTEQRSTERELALHRAIGRSLAAWRSFDAGGRELLREVGQALGVSAGVLWMPQGELLVGRAVWSESTVDRAVLKRLVGDAQVVAGAGVTGRAWQLGEPSFPCRDEPDSRLPDCLARALDGLRPHVAVPAVSDGEVLAVLSFYSADPTEIGQRMLNAFSAVGEQLGDFLRRHPALATGEALSARELEVLALAADGLNRQDVERTLGLSPATVKTHFEHIYRKLGVTNRAAAVAHALRRGLIS
jgi:PAS domain S-box-containing protein